MAKEYTKEQLWKLYENLPPALQEAIFSEENAEHIGSICERYGLEEGKISEVAKLVGRVFLGILPPDNFQGALEKEAGLTKDTGKQVVHEINRFVFAPVKEYLTQIYHIGVKPAEKPARGEKIQPTAEKIKEEPVRPAEEKPEETDTYRESIEE